MNSHAATLSQLCSNRGGPYPDHSRPSPPHLALERTPSQPSLTNSNNTADSDEHATTPTAIMYPGPLPQEGKVILESDQHSFAQDSFSERRQRRISLSRSLQNLRDKTEKTRRRLSVSSSKMSTPPLNHVDLPPVPALPAMYRGLGSSSGSESPEPRRTASATVNMQSAPPLVAAPPPPAPKTKTSIGSFFRKLTGRKDKAKPVDKPVYTTLTHRTGGFKPVPVVEPPQSVRAVLAEMGTASTLTGRRATYRKSMIKRVPVPIYDPDEDIIIPRSSASSSERHNKVPLPDNAADARAAALRALEGTPVTTPRRLPSASDSDTDPIIKRVSVSPPMVTHVHVTEPESAEFDTNTNDTNRPISPRLQSVKLVQSRSASGASDSSGIHSIKEMSKTNNLSDFGTYDSSESDESEGADVVRPLQLRIPPRITTTGTSPTESGSISPRTPRTPLSPYGGLPATPEDGLCVSTPTSSGFDHSSVGHASLGAPSVSEFGDSQLDRVSSTTSSRTRRTQRSPYAGSQTYAGSTSGHSHSPRDARFAGSRSAYAAPVGDGLSTDGHSRRNSSRLQRGLSRRMSQRPREPPSSHDAYMQKQAEMLSRRQSCKPMIHSGASIAAEVSEVRDKEASHVMETFFMS